MYKRLFQSDAAWRITRNTILYNIGFIFTTVVFSVLIALLLNMVTKRYVKIYQTALFFPYFISFVVVSYIFIGFLDMEHGFLNTILGWFGTDAVLWYNEDKYWLYILVIVNLWKGVGYSAIIYYTAIIGFDSDYYEAAEIDGATKWLQVRFITLPLLKPLVILMIMLAISRIFFGSFDLFYNVTLDSAMLYPTTDIIDTFVYRELRKTGDIGMASAAGFYQSMVGFVIILVTNTVTRKLSKENALF